MSDLSIPLSALERKSPGNGTGSTTPSHPQLPVTSYFDEDLFRREQELIFQHGPRYLGHALAVPEVAEQADAVLGAWPRRAKDAPSCAARKAWN